MSNNTTDLTPDERPHDPHSALDPLPRAVANLRDADRALQSTLDHNADPAVRDLIASVARRLLFIDNALREVGQVMLHAERSTPRFVEVVTDGRRLEWNGAPVLVEAEDERRALTALAYWLSRDDATRAGMLFAVLHTTLPRNVSRPPLHLWHETLTEF